MMELIDDSLVQARNVLCAHFPDPLPNETLFSLTARFHQLTAFKRPALTGQLLFGSSRAVKKKCVPVGLGTLVRSLPDVFKSPTDALHDHTHGTLYLRFMTKQQHMRCVAACASSMHYRERLSFGWTSSTFEALHPMRFCPLCAKKDEDLHGTPFWHLHHQLPGTLICTDHMLPLNCDYDNSRGSSWVLPSRFHSTSSIQIENSKLPAFACLADTVKRLCGRKTANLQGLRSAICVQLEEVGIARASRALNEDNLRQWIKSALAIFETPAILKSTGANNLSDAISGILGKRLAHHPLRWALLITALRLEGCADSTIYQAIEEEEQWPLPGFKNIGAKLAPSIAYKAVADGAPIQAICQRQQLSRSVVQRWLTDPDVHATWSSARKRNIRNRHEESISSALSAGIQTRLGLKVHANAAFQWFQINDPEYLDQILKRDFNHLQLTLRF